MRLLLVEDDRMIGDSLVRGLGYDGYHVDWVRDGVAAAAALADPAADFALVLLDWGLPRQDGMSVLKELRARHSLVPVLMITARDTLQDRVQGPQRRGRPGCRPRPCPPRCKRHFAEPRAGTSGSGCLDCRSGS